MADMKWDAFYASVRDRNLQRLAQRRKKIYFFVPALQDLQNEYISAQIKKGLSSASHKEKEVKEAEKEILEILIKQNELLKSNDFDVNSFDLEHDCDKCKDYGYINGELCNCQNYMRKDAIYNTKRGQELLFEDESFENFDLNVFPAESDQRAKMEKVRDICLDYSMNFPQNNIPNILILGDAGLGKSYLSGCINKKIAERGYTSYKITGNQFHQLIMEKLIGERNYASYQKLKKFDLLVLDDLGAEPILNGFHAAHYLFSLLDERILTKKSMIINSNCSINELQHRYGARTVSRILDRKKFYVYRLSGQDLRLLKR